MASMELQQEVASVPSEPTNPNLTLRMNDSESQRETHSVGFRNTDPESTSVDTADEAIDEDTVKNDSTQQSPSFTSELGSLKQDEGVDEHEGKDADEDTNKDKDEDEDEDEDKDEYKDLSSWLEQQPKKLNVKWSNYEQFKNRFSLEEGHDIIEVLAGREDQIRTDFFREQSTRQRKHSTSRGKSKVEKDRSLMQRVRIQSPTIEYVLSRLMDRPYSNIDRSRVYLRPFQAFYYTLPSIKQVLRILERRYNEDQRQEEDVARFAGPQQHFDEIPPIEAEDALQKLSTPLDVNMEDVAYDIPDFKYETNNDLTSIEHMRLYIDFVEKHIVPMWVEARGSSKPKVQFSDLPMYFRPGDTCFMPLRSADEKYKAGKSGTISPGNSGLEVIQSYWKLCYAQFQGLDHQEENGNPIPFGVWMASQEFAVYGFHVDFDGNRYGPLTTRCPILKFEGEKDIRELAVYPLRFNADAAQTLCQLAARGEAFRSYVQQRHLHYDGWSLIHESFGLDLLIRDQKRRGVEHIEGEIMIDFKEGFQSDSGFKKPQFDLPPESDPSSAWAVDYLLQIDNEKDMAIEWWSDTTRSKMKGFRTDVVAVLGDSFSNFQLSYMVKEDKVLRSFKEHKTVFEFDSEHLSLFSQRLIAYSFRARKFFVANIDHISVIKTLRRPFRDLKIQSEHKRVLKSIVGRHFQKQDIRRRNKDAIIDQDFIQGKGSGLVILLHGAPGVGKTTTAEAIALDNHKPLFALTSGDLGSSARDVEKALRETFRLAAMWDCVLLLDEADLFLAKRDVGDLERNSLVSVFLRVLEYYDGVLFLTTNRVGTVDEGFRSRIHISLYYPILGKKQTLEIFKLNIQRIKEIERSMADLRGTGEDGHPSSPPTEIDEGSILAFATRHWENTRKTPSRRWNGRQIRNSFQIAYSLVNLDQVNVLPSSYNDDYDDDDVDYGDEPEAEETPPTGKDSGVPPTPPTTGTFVQEQKLRKLDSSQFEIVARSIQRFDNYLDKTRGPDSDYAKNKNLRRDDYQDSDEEDRSPGPYYGMRMRRSSPRREARFQSSTSSAHLEPPFDRGERRQRGIAREREQRSYGSRRGPDDDDDDYAEEMMRSSAGGPPGSSSRSRPRDYDDDGHEYAHYRHH